MLTNQEMITYTPIIKEFLNRNKAEFYFETMNREKAEKKLSKESESTFLLRYSENISCLVISLKWKEEFHHIAIMFNNLKQMLAASIYQKNLDQVLIFLKKLICEKLGINNPKIILPFVRKINKNYIQNLSYYLPINSSIENKDSLKNGLQQLPNNSFIITLQSENTLACTEVIDHVYAIFKNSKGDIDCTDICSNIKNSLLDIEDFFSEFVSMNADMFTPFTKEKLENKNEQINLLSSDTKVKTLFFKNPDQPDSQIKNYNLDNPNNNNGPGTIN